MGARNRRHFVGFHGPGGPGAGHAVREPLTSQPCPRKSGEREKKELSPRHCERSEAIHASHAEEEWIASSLRSSQDGDTLRDLAAGLREVRPRIFRHLKIRGRRECRVPNAPAASCALCSCSMHTSIHSGGTGIHPAFPTQWFYGLYRALPGDRAFLPPSSAEKLVSQELSASVGASGPHDFAVRVRLARQARRPRPPHPAPRP